MCRLCFAEQEFGGSEAAVSFVAGAISLMLEVRDFNEWGGQSTLL